MTKQRTRSLFARTALMIVGGVIMTFLVNLLLNAAGRWAIDTFYMSDAAVDARNRALLHQLQTYAEEHHVSSTDYNEIESWSASTPADLYIFEDNGVYEAGSWGKWLYTEDETDTAELDKWGYLTDSVVFADGTRRVALADCSDIELQTTVRFVVTWLSFLAFVSTLLFYAHRISIYLRSFSADVSAISSGEAEHVDETRGFRELSSLAADVNHMHDVITERTSSAQEALQSNRELITALSHDIRNPLTSLIGYLDLLGMEEKTLTETQRKYVAACAEKADRIRTLTDEMFRYFLIFSDRKPRLNTERFDAQILLEQMIGEQAIELESSGFHVICDPLEQSCQIETDSSMLSRVFENLFSNIRKYADPKDPVMLAVHLQDGDLHVSVANTVNPSPPNSTESNRIGLRVCAVIMEQLNGTFRAGAENGVFTAQFTLPVLPET